MANNIWTNAATGNDANTAGNWSLGWVPKAGDVMYFTNVGGGGSEANCNLSGNITAGPPDEINVTAGYGGDIDMVTHDLTTSGDMTFDGTGIFDCGTGTLTCAGNFDYKDQATWTRSTSTVHMTGSGGTITATSDSAKRIHHLTISDDTSLHVDTVSYLYMSGVLTVDAGKTFTCDNDSLRTGSANHVINGTLSIGSGKTWVHFGGTITIGAVGAVSGAGTFVNSEGGAIINGGTWSLAAATLGRSWTLSAATYGGAFTFTQTHPSTNRTVIFGGNCIFTGDVTFNNNKVNRTYTINLATNDVNVEFQADLTLQEIDGTATLVWSKPTTGTITFGGTTEYTDSTAAIQVLGDVDVDGTSLKLLTEMECDDFDGTSGSLDANGQTLDVGGNMDWPAGFVITDPVGSTFEVAGNFTAAGQDISGASGGWNLDVAGTAVASGNGDVANCTAGDTEIDASAGPWTDSGGNTNWNFGVVAIGGSPLHMESPLLGSVA